MKTKKNYITISEVVEKFKKYYPDISTSKVRFLESKGLISPKRTESKYRIYSKEDIVKLDFILKMQKQYYLPLSAIKEKINSVDFVIDYNNEDIIKQLKFDLIEESNISLKDDFITKEEIIRKLEIKESFLNELIDENVIYYEEVDDKKLIKSSEIEIIRIAVELLKYGIQPKNLKLFDNFSLRECSFMHQIVFPVIMSGSKESVEKASSIIKELEMLLSNMRHLMVKRNNRAFLEQYK
ncbi:MAG: MerR family transcriptional regulator [Actinomycetota bacterium]|nr:MerR family transcriptional regulator [Actinomycetota bacterium]